MTDFIVYISAQQRMQAAMNDTDALDTPRSGRTRLMAWSGIHAVWQKVSITLFRLAEAIQPPGAPASALVNAPHESCRTPERLRRWRRAWRRDVSARARGDIR